MAPRKLTLSAVRETLQAHGWDLDACTPAFNYTQPSEVLVLILHHDLVTEFEHENHKRAAILFRKNARNSELTVAGLLAQRKKLLATLHEYHWNISHVAKALNVPISSNIRRSIKNLYLEREMALEALLQS